MREINIGMIGGGTVGSGVFHAFQTNGALMESRLGVKLNFRKIAVKAFDEPRPYEIPKPLMTLDWQNVVNDPNTQIIIELVGGTGRPVVVVAATASECGRCRSRGPHRRLGLATAQAVGRDVPRSPRT